MKNNGKYEDFTTAVLVDVKSRIDYKSSLQSIKAIDFTLVDMSTITLAITFEKQGVYLCELTTDAINPQPYVFIFPTLKCNRTDSSVMIDQIDAVSTWFNP